MSALGDVLLKHRLLIAGGVVQTQVEEVTGAESKRGRQSPPVVAHFLLDVNLGCFQ